MEDDDVVVMRTADRRKVRVIASSLGMIMVLTQILVGCCVLFVAMMVLGIVSMGDPLGIPEPKEPGQVDFPFEGLGEVRGIASHWDYGDFVYIIDDHADNGGRVLELAPDGTEQQELPFPSLSQPQDIAVDEAGNVYVADNVAQLGPDGIVTGWTGHVYKLAPDAASPVELPLADVGFIEALAVGGEDETVYIAERGEGGDAGRVLELRSWETEYTVLPIEGLVAPRGLAISDDGDLFVVDYATKRLLEIYLGRGLSASAPVELESCQPTGLMVDSNTKYMMCEGGSVMVIRGDGAYVQDVPIDGEAVDIAPSNGNWSYVVLRGDGGDKVVTFVPEH